MMRFTEKATLREYMIQPPNLAMRLILEDKHNQTSSTSPATSRALRKKNTKLKSMNLAQSP